MHTTFSIDGYKQSELTRQLQQIELEMTEVLLDFCKKNNLSIWACFGTLLGAARHKGFIPWDDDIDFVMMRSDYDRLVMLCRQDNIKKTLPKYYAFDTDDISVIKLRRSDTTAIHPWKRLSKKMNHGIWIDIFCLDDAPDDIRKEYDVWKKINSDVRLYRNRKYSYYAMHDSFSFRIRHAMVRLFFLFHSLEGFRNKIEENLHTLAFNYSGDKIWPFMVWSLAKDVDKVPCYEKSWFDKTILLPFENIEIPCPVGWNELLTTQYGDWNTPVMGTSLHEGCVFNLEKPYAEGLKEHLAKMPFWKRYTYRH